MSIAHEIYFKRHGSPRLSLPYLLGLVCLIPLAGALVGLILILYGIFKYKDRVLILIGAFGILFTLVVYSFVFYVASNTKLAKSGFAELSQMQLNKLVQSIEVYKQHHGQYPADLQQLKTDNKAIIIEDPVRGAKVGSPLYFNYQKLGGKYTLYSSGPDESAGTADDLFPQIADGSGIGWVKK